MSVIITRHGEPWKSYNEIPDLVVANKGLELGPNGFQQAKKLGQDTKPFDVILSSLFVRCLQTGRTVWRIQGGIAEFLGLSDLGEVNFGELTREALKNWINTGLNEGGETVAQARVRVRRALSIVKHIENKCGDDMRILIVTHRLLYSVFLLESEALRDDIPVSNLKNNVLIKHAEPRVWTHSDY